MGGKRCPGMVIVDTLLDGNFDERMSGVGGWRCIYCGEWLDIGARRSRAASRSRWSQVKSARRTTPVSRCITR